MAGFLSLKIKNQFAGHKFPTKTKIERHHAERFAFNLSFLTRDTKYNLEQTKTVTKKVRLKLLERMYQLSQQDIVEVMNLRRDQGLEQIPEEQTRVSINPEFKSTKRYEECDGNKFWVFRLGKQGRVLGKINGNIFYILSIDATFDQYDHGS